MDVTRDVILDLLPIYLAGEASPGTRRIVTEFLARDPELAEEVRDQQKRDVTLRDVVISPDLEMKSLRRTRRLLSLRQWSFGLGWLFTAIGLSMRGKVSGWNLGGLHPLFMDYPIQFGAVLVLAVLCWTTYFILKRRSRATI